MVPYRLGEKAVLYYSATALTAVVASGTVPTTTLPKVGSPKIDAPVDTPNYDTRDNNGIKQYAVSMKDFTISFDLLVPGVGVTDAGYTAVRNAYINGTEICIVALNGDKADAGSEGPAGNWVVSKWGEDQSNGKVLYRNVELKPSSKNSYYVSEGSGGS